MEKGTLGLVRKGVGATFGLYSESAATIDLLISNRHGKIVEKLPMKGQHGYWRVEKKKIDPTLFYSYSIDGSDPILDPYAQQIFLKPIPCSPLAPLPPFDWQGISPPRHLEKELIIYEMHLRGFTSDPSSEIKNPGTFLGLIEKIPHLLELGINAVELMPIQAFDPKYHLENKNVENFWGYGPLNFFSIHSDYGTPTDLKLMVRALHQAGIEVYLDVAFSHTSSPKLCFETLDKELYYILDEEGEHTNFSGCGRTFNTAHPITRQMIIGSLRQFVLDYHIDGFRFDLAAIMTRDQDGTPLKCPPLIKEIVKDSALSQVKLIAEPWDAAGLYLVGHFPHFGHFSEWNGQYRDIVRSFIKGDESFQAAFARSLTGSEMIYGPMRGPHKSINFITAHDGYTLADLVAYEKKHNYANLENNQDGNNANFSWNCGIEGPTSDPKIRSLRLRQMKNFIVALFTSVGTPMMLMGDEYGHTRKGNNNPWCQNNELNWFQWDQLEERRDFFHFVQHLIKLRKRFAFLKRRSYFNSVDIDWHGTIPHEIDWTQKGRFLAYTIHSTTGCLYIAYNAHFDPLEVTLPKSRAPWEKVVDTNLPYPEDIAPTPIQSPFRMNAHTTIVLWSNASSS